MLMVLDYMAEQGDYDELHRTLDRFGKQIKALKGRYPPPVRWKM